MDLRELAEQFIREMQWSPEASDLEKTLVIGNLRGFVGWLEHRLRHEPAVRAVMDRDATSVLDAGK